MASGARRNRKYRSCRRVFGVGRLLPGRQVAPGISAVRRRDLQAVIATDVATRTGNIGVPVGQWKIDRRRRVIYRGSQPAVKVVTGITSLRKLRRYVIRIGGLLKIRQVARGAGRRKTLELAHSSALVAIFALHRRVRPQQRETILVILDLLDRNIPALHRVDIRAQG